VGGGGGEVGGGGGGGKMPDTTVACITYRLLITRIICYLGLDLGSANITDRSGGLWEEKG
jgi:hypothetical protein